MVLNRRFGTDLSVTLSALLLGSFMTLLLSGYLSVPFATPPRLEGDNLFFFTLAKAATVGENLVHIRSLAFPEGMSFYRFPILDFTQMGIIKLIALFTSSPFAIWTIFHAAVSVIGFIACFILFLSLSGRPVDAAVVAWGCQFFAFVERSHNHNFLFASYSVPFGCYLALYSFWPNLILLSRHKALAAMQRWVLPILSIFVVSTSGLYFLFFTLTLIVLSVVVSFVRGGPIALLKPAGAIVMCVGTFLLMCALIYPQALFGTATALPVRDIWEQPTAGLRISDALIQLARNRYNPASPFLIPAITRYVAGRDTNEGWDAFAGPLLTMFVLMTPVFAVGMQRGPVRRWFSWDRKWESLHVFSVASILFIILFAAPYGYGMIFNTLATATIRGQNRFSVFMNIFAALLMWGLVRYLFARRTYLIAPVLILLFLLNDYSNFMYWSKSHIYYPPDRAYITSAQSAVKKIPPSDRSVVLQLPYSGFPEVPPVRLFEPYSHLILPLVYPATDLSRTPRWSYGLMDSQFSFSMIRAALAVEPGNNWSANAACYGFNHIVVEKRAYDVPPQPDSKYWLLRVNDEFRQLWSLRPDGLQAAECPNSYRADYRQRLSRLALEGQDRAWHVDDVAAFLRQSTARAAVFLPAAQGTDRCLHLKATFIKREDVPDRSKELYVSLGENAVRLSLDSRELSYEGDFHVSASQWVGPFVFLTLSEIPPQVSVSTRLATWWANRTVKLPRALGIQTLLVTPGCQE